MSAIISLCGRYRYRLDRKVAESGPVVAIVGVNPSTADAKLNDATIRKDMGFARRHGWSRIIKINKFAWRATDVRQLRTATDPIGLDNDRWIEGAMREADFVVAAWGPLSKIPRLPMSLRNRWLDVHGRAMSLDKRVMSFGTAKCGHPRHTLMIPYDTPLTEWEPPRS